LTELDSCPYVGLDPFTREHAKYFFGRAVDSAVIADNVLARPITVLYGTSGVGKSSVLNVGLPAALTEDRAVATIVSRRQWHDPSSFVAWLDDAIKAAQSAPKQPVVVVLDQFEEYFLYRSTQAGDAFERALAALLTRTDLEAHLLFSLRDDGLHLLDALRLRLPTLLDNTIELKHLDETAVREAITGPIDVYNQGDGAADPVRFGPGFVDDLLGRLCNSLSAVAQRRSAAPEGVVVELPFLQLTLQRIWERMRELDGQQLDSELLDALGGVDGIVSAHFRDKLAALSEGERQLACHVFHYLVTPSGGKFAHLPKDLAWLISETAGRTIDAADIGRLLQKLADGKARVLRRTGERFELFHDVLARPILDWRAVYLEQAPFGFLIEVLTGTTFPLPGHGCLFGRLTDSEDATPISLRPVSRNHLMILKDGQILDQRSRFGTTVNAQPLHFGSIDTFLRSGDVVGLANTAALIFWRAEDATPDGRTRWEDATSGMGEGWGLLIDGGARRVTRLIDATLYLVLGGDGALAMAKAQSPEAFAMLRRNDSGEVRITALDEDTSLEVIEREDSYHDNIRMLARREEFLIELRGIEHRRPNTISDVEGAERGLFRLGERYFEIIVDVPR
jgi:hypothetical protein